MPNPEKLIQALSHMSMLSIEGYAELCYFFIDDNNVSNTLISNYENNFKLIHNSNSNYGNPKEEALDNLFNHNNLSEEAMCYFIESFVGLNIDYIFQKYCPHIHIENSIPA